MPYESVWREPRRFLTHKGVDIYCTYKDDDWNNGENTYHFSNSVIGEWTADGPSDFDVRDLPTFVAPPHPPFLCGKNNTPKNQAAWKLYHESKAEEKAIKKAIRKAIDKGLIKKGQE